MKSPWIIVQRVEWTVIVLCTSFLVIDFVTFLINFGK